MITDDQGTQILKKMDAKFGEIDTKLEKISTILKEHSTKLDEHSAILGEHSYNLEHIIPMLVDHDSMLRKLPTREEFDEFRSENASAHDHMAKSIEKLDQELRAGAKIQDRTKEKVDMHERVLIAHKLLPAKAV
jgi:hypothetical protein